MSKLCAYLVSKGLKCSGSDREFSDNIAKLRDIGVTICVGVDERLASAADIVVYNAAISDTHPERLAAKLAIERKELLGMVEAQFNCSIAVSGAHGKTTVSGMISYIMKTLGLDVMAHVGGDVIGMPAFVNACHNDYIVVEACEYSRSFLQLNPDFGIIVNIDYDHPDCYIDIEDTYSAFAEFLTKTQQFALIDVACKQKLIYLTRGRLHESIDIFTFGDSCMCDYYVANICKQDNGYTFDLIKRGNSLGNFYIAGINAINIKCAMIAIAACDIMHFPSEKVKVALEGYRGVKRRMEYLGKTKIGANVYTDYAHHPSELLSLHTNLPMDVVDNTILIFEPHTYSRTKALFDKFIDVLKLFKRVVILPTYAAREKESRGLSGEQLHEAIIDSGGKCDYFHNWNDLASIIDSIKSTDTILLVGAGIDYMGILQVLKQ